MLNFLDTFSMGITKRETLMNRHQWRKQEKWIVTNSLMKKREKEN